MTEEERWWAVTMKTIQRTEVPNNFRKSYRYKNELGEISLLFPTKITINCYEIYCIKGNLFSDIERFDTIQEAENKIAEYLKVKQ